VVTQDFVVCLAIVVSLDHQDIQDIVDYLVTLGSPESLVTLDFVGCPGTAVFADLVVTRALVGAESRVIPVSVVVGYPDILASLVLESPATLGTAALADTAATVG
jgi:hypothetical protein